MEKKVIKNQQRKFRHKRVRSKIKGDRKRPRLCVFRSNKNIFLQLIDDQKGKTLIGLSDRGIKSKNKTERAFLAGQQLAKKALELKIKKVVFDRGGYKYHGRVKAVAEGALKGGLKI